MSTITLHEAQSRLSELVHQLGPGAELIITEGQRPIARLVGITSELLPPRPRPPVTGVPKAGQYEGRLVIPENFDEPLEELREYME